MNFVNEVSKTERPSIAQACEMRLWPRVNLFWTDWNGSVKMRLWSAKNSTVMKPLSMVHLEEFSGISEFVKVAPILMTMTTPWPIPDAAEIITMFAISSHLWFRLSICHQDDRLIKSADIGPNKSIIYFLDLFPWWQDMSPRLFLHLWKTVWSDLI